MKFTVNGQEREQPEPLRLVDVIGEVRRGVAVAVDGVVIPRARHAETELSEGAKVEIVTAVQGG